MSVEKTKKVIRDFILNSSAEVLSIKGNWGVGKTFFWKQVVTQAKDDKKFCCQKYSYVSLFNIASLAELKAAIFENLVGKSQIDKGFTLDNLSQNIEGLLKQAGRAGIKQFLNVSSYIRTPYVQNVESALFSAAFRSVKDTLICIDDFERKGDKLSTKEVLGLISHLKEESNCKVALIFSDANFDDASKQDYAQFREKVVDVEVRFAPTPEEAAALVFTPSEIDTQLSTFTNALQISNIRILQRIKKAAYRAAPLLEGFDQQITYAALQTLALFGWSYYSHTHDKKVPSYSYVTSFNYHFGREKKNEQERDWDVLLRQYGFQATDELDIALSSLIENGFIDEESVRMEAHKIHQRLDATKSRDEFNEAWALFYTFDKDEEEVVNTFESLLRKHVMHVSTSGLNNMVLLLRELNRHELASELIDFYISARRKNGDKAVFDFSRNLLFGEKVDEEVERKFNLQMASMEETPTIEDVLAHLAKDQGWNSAQEEVLASATLDDFCRIFKSVTGKTLHSYVNASLMFGRLGNASNRQMAIFQKAKEALLKIAAESQINRIRVKRYGISSEEQVSLPL